MIEYVKGDATVLRYGKGIIAHVANNRGAWGAGFVIAVSNRWSQPELRYRLWAKNGYDASAGTFKLGETQFVALEDGKVIVANMVAQDGFGSPGRIPLQYDALELCLDAVARKAKEMKLPVQMPRIGCGLAGGSWDKVEPIVARSLYGVDVVVFDF